MELEIHSRPTGPDGIDCRLMGALGQGCGATPVLQTTWGRIKAQYRDR